MTDLPAMMMYWGRFFASADVENLPTAEARGVWALMLGKMWLNGGWIKADDRIVADKLGLDIRRWRHTYKPLFEPLLRRQIDPHVGAIYTQKTLTSVRASALEMVAKNKARTARATAAKAAKARKARSVTEPPAANVSSNVTKPVTDIATTSKTDIQKERTLPIKKGESSFQPTEQGLGASSGEIVASGLPPAAVASPGLEGGSLPPPSPALLRSKIVREGRNGNAAEPDADAERDHDHQEPVSEPQRAEPADSSTAGLFGALEAAIRAAKADDE